MIHFIQLFTSVASDFAFLPALFVVIKHRRHFEIYIATFQIVAAILYNTCQAIHASIFLSALQWHFINDVLLNTFVATWFIHVASIHKQDINILLRYLAFTLSWIAKTKDQWDSIFYQAIVICSFMSLAAAGYLYATVIKQQLYPGDKRNYAQFDNDSIIKGKVFLAVSLVLFLLQLNATVSPIVTGSMHLAAGAASYYLWKGIPVALHTPLDVIMEKNSKRSQQREDIPSFV